MPPARQAYRDAGLQTEGLAERNDKKKRDGKREVGEEREGGGREVGREG